MRLPLDGAARGAVLGGFGCAGGMAGPGKRRDKSPVLTGFSPQHSSRGGSGPRARGAAARGEPKNT
jgi:hypothetical protein